MKIELLDEDHWYERLRAQIRIYYSHIFSKVIMCKRKYLIGKSASTVNVSVRKDFQIVEQTTKTS